MKLLLALSVFFVPFSSFAQGDLPDWLLPDSTERQVYVQGIVALQADSMHTAAKLNVHCDGDELSYTLYSDEKGFYEFFLHENKQYTLTFSKAGYIDKRIQIVTTGVPEKAWRRGFAVVVDVFMEDKPLGFDDEVAQEPMGVCRYNEKSKRFDFDQDLSRMRREAIDAEIDRCRNK